MEEDGRRWKKMEEDGRKKVRNKSKKKRPTNFCLESAGDGLGTLIGVQIAPKKIFWALGYDFFKKKCHINLTVVLRIDSYESN